MKKKNLLVTATATALALSMAFGGTMAYFSATSVTVENDIAVDYNWVKLTESGTTYDEDNDVYVNNSYEIIPGTTQDKDPTVTVSYNVDSYVFLYVTDATNGLVTYEIESDWTELTSYENDDGNTVTVYYQLVEYNSASAKTSEDGISYNLSDLSVLVNDSISYSSSIVNGTGENGNGITVAEDGTPSGTATVSLTFKAYIVQADVFADVNSAYLVSNGTGVVIDEAGVAYTSLSAAVSAASNGDTITLIADTEEELDITSTKDVTICFNNATLTGSVTVSGSATGTTITLTAEGDGGITNANGSAISTYMCSAAVVIDSGTYVGSTYAVNASQAKGGLTINGGDFTGTTAVIYNNAFGNENTVTINNGNFTGPYIVKYYAFAYSATTIINDGTFNATTANTTGSALLADYTTTINGGTFSIDPSDDGIAEGYQVVTNDDGTYTVTVAE